MKAHLRSLLRRINLSRGCRRRRRHRRCLRSPYCYRSSGCRCYSERLLLVLLLNILFGRGASKEVGESLHWTSCHERASAPNRLSHCYCFIIRLLVLLSERIKATQELHILGEKPLLSISKVCLISPERDGDKTYNIPSRGVSYVFFFLFFFFAPSVRHTLCSGKGGVGEGDAPALLQAS